MRWPSGARPLSCRWGIFPARPARGILPSEKIIAEIPRILFRGGDAALEQLREAKTLGINRAWCGNLGAIHLAREAGLTPVGGYSLNITNSWAVREYARLGLEDVELSFELPLADAKRFGDYLPQGILAYGLSAADGAAELPHQCGKGMQPLPGV